MKWQFVGKMQLAFSAALVLLLVVGVVSYRNNGNQAKTEEWVAHTREVLATLAGVLSDETEAESARRAYFITSDSVFLRKYETSAAAAYASLARLRQLTVDNAPQQRRLDALEPLITRRLRLLGQLIDSQGKNPSDVALQVSKTLEGEQLQARVRGLLAEMVGAERTLLQSGIAKARASTRLAIFTILLGTGLALGLSGAALYLLQREITQRTRAEEAQGAGEAKFRGILESAPDAMVIADAQGRIVLINAETERLFGYRREDLVGQLVDVLVPERFRGKHPQHREGYTAHPLTRSMGAGLDLWGLRKDNTEFPVEISLSPIETPEGTLISSAIRDVTARKRAEKALRDSEAKFRGILESAPDAMVIVDAQGRIVLVNIETERLFGYPREELIGQAVEVLVPDQFRGRHPEHRQGYTAHPRPRSMGEGLELRGLRKDNTEFPVEISLSPIETLEGSLISSTIRDVTARKTAEEALREAGERFRTLANNISQLAWMADEKGYIFWYNQRWFDYTGTALEEMAGWGWQKVHHPDHVQQVVAKISKCFQSGEVWEDTFPLRGRDGNYRWFLSLAVPIRGTEGKILRWFGTNTDITERKKSEERLLKTVGELKRSNDELQQFAYVASHDLQEPLRMVASYTQLLAKRYKGRLDPDADEFIAYAVDGSNRMQGMIQDLLAYSRAGTNGKVLHEISSENALKEALTNLRATILESGAVVTHDSLPAITTDDTQLTQVFQNLVGNAIKYRSAEVPHVNVSATKNGGKEWIFSVRDNGLGIDPQYFDRIFVLFQRLHGREEFEGTGIGLAICKKILERLGGRIWVESQPEKGSTFYFALPERDGK